MTKNFKPKQGKLLPYYWHNGNLLNHKMHGQPTVPTFSQAMDYSVVLIEGIRINVSPEGKIYGFRIEDHIDRLLTGVKKLSLSCKYSKAEIINGLKTCVQENLKHLKETGKITNLYIRPKIYSKEQIFKPFGGKNCSIVIECFPLENYLSPSGISANLANYVRTHLYSSHITKGAGKYPEYGMIRNSSNDYEDILQLGLGKGGKLIFTEGATHNIFFVKKGKLLTPGVEDFILDGVTRNSVIKMAKYLKIKVEEREVGLSEIFESEEIFITATASFITPIKQLGIYQLKTAKITQELIEFFEKVRFGKVSQFKNWLTEFKI